MRPITENACFMQMKRFALTSANESHNELLSASNRAENVSMRAGPINFDPMAN